MQKETQKELKAIPFSLIKGSSQSGRIRTGIAAVFGNVDSGSDRLHSGAFTKTLQEGTVRHKHLWGHDWSQPPIASIKELREIGLNELPDQVKAFAPDATGGLLVTREYFRGAVPDLVLQAVDAGDMEMSIGYTPKQMDWTEVKNADGTEDRVRELKEVQLLETSDVPFGMNAATIASFAKALNGGGRPLGSILFDLQMCVHNIKAGRRNSAQDFAILEQIHEKLLDLGFSMCKGVMQEDEKSLSTNDDHSVEAESAIHSNSLLANELKLNDLRLSQFFRSENYVSTSRQTERI